MTTMTTDLQTEFDALSTRAREAANAYYNGPAPIMPDDEYDAIIDRMNALSAQHNLDAANTPLETVGAAVEEGSEEHSIPMLSLAKVTTDADLKKFLNTLNSRVMVQPKLDGVSMSLEYTAGNLTRAVTRGDGTRGEDVTFIVKHLPSVPTSLREPFTGVVRGEVVIHRDELNPKFKNTRNAVSGCLNYKTKKPMEAVKNHCRFYAFDLYGDDIANSELGSLNLSNYGFQIPLEFTTANAHSAVEHVYRLIEERTALPYDIDGVVVKVSSYEQRESMGNRSNSPRWAVAYKAASETAVTRLNDVVWQTGKGGTVTPVAVLEPVDLAGVTISRASLHNMAQVKKLGIKIGDEVVVKRANDVIPQVVGVAVGNIDGEQIDPPYDCPTCYFKLEQQGNSEQVVCPNLNCKAQLAGKLEKWASRDAADIDAIGPSWIEVFFEKGLVTGPADFYSLTRANLIGLPRMGEGNRPAPVPYVRFGGSRTECHCAAVGNCGGHWHGSSRVHRPVDARPHDCQDDSSLARTGRQPRPIG
jgi:DNA ligase (NAD+)